MVEHLQQALENTIKSYRTRYQVVVRADENRDTFNITMFAVVGTPAHGQVLLTATAEIEMDDLLSRDMTSDILEAMDYLNTKMQQAVDKEPF
jgi:hypothetical protein